MSEESDFRDKIAAIHAEFDQFRAAIIEVAQTVCDYRQKLRSSRQFAKEEQFMLTMEYQSMVLTAILAQPPRFDPEIPDFPPEE